ncbi:MAG: hypothetical protein QGG36_12535 [Pirellulaceae bacterium]|jgi:hypothetical protein|nr:hypothetical protein [Pirellulaceae bacterium]MDP7016623.1 hypothetical protein [Pirellulaceae bacterium]
MPQSQHTNVVHLPAAAVAALLVAFANGCVALHFDRGIDEAAALEAAQEEDASRHEADRTLDQKRAELEEIARRFDGIREEEKNALIRQAIAQSQLANPSEQAAPGKPRTRLNTDRQYDAARGAESERSPTVADRIARQTAGRFPAALNGDALNSSLNSPREPTRMQIGGSAPVETLQQPYESIGFPPAASNSQYDAVVRTSGVSSDRGNLSTVGGKRLNWREHLRESIRALENDQGASDEDNIRRLEATLHLMYLLAGEENSALRSLDSMGANQQQFWRDMIFALSIELDADAAGTSSLKNAQVVRALRSAVNTLAKDSTLAVRNIAFCSSVASYGVYSAFEKNQFKAGQPVLLYFEVENFSAVQETEGYRTQLIGAYSIHNETGKTVATNEFPAATEVCKNRRRDYFIRYEMAIPKHLGPGEYTLRLSVNDEIGHKFTDRGSIEFEVK